MEDKNIIPFKKLEKVTVFSEQSGEVIAIIDALKEDVVLKKGFNCIFGDIEINDVTIHKLYISKECE